MRLSSGFGMSELVGVRLRSMAQDLDASACERADGLVVGISFVALASVEGLAVGVLSEQKEDWKKTRLSVRLPPWARLR